MGKYEDPKISWSRSSFKDCGKEFQHYSIGRREPLKCYEDGNDIFCVLKCDPNNHVRNGII